MAETEEIQDVDTPEATPEEVVQDADGAGKAADAAPKTLLDTVDDEGKQVPADFPEDWRARMAGGDEKALKRLERMKSPADVLKWATNADAKVNSMQATKPLAEDASEEEVAAWRSQNGIPQDPKGYMDLMEGVVPGEGDEPLLDSFFGVMHEGNTDPKTVNAALDWYYKAQEAQIAAGLERDNEQHVEAEEALRAEWGGEYRGNMNQIKNYLQTLPTMEDGTGLGDLVADARLPDGSLLFNSPAAVKWLADVVGELNPAGFVAPSDGAGQLESIAEEIASIEAKMGTKAYTKDEKMQARYRELLDAQEKISSRAA